jgi:hypothetical protein
MSVQEIIDTGTCAKLSHFDADERILTLRLFGRIWGVFFSRFLLSSSSPDAVVAGVGSAAAQRWYAQGLRTLDDVRQRGDPTARQQIGLRYIDVRLEISDREREKANEYVCGLGV